MRKHDGLLTRLSRNWWSNRWFPDRFALAPSYFRVFVIDSLTPQVQKKRKSASQKKNYPQIIALMI
jgi:hypothetical protein